MCVLAVGLTPIGQAARSTGELPLREARRLGNDDVRVPRHAVA